MKAVLRFVALFVVFCLPIFAFGKEAWTRVESKNFLLVGNADETKIRQIAARLEQFRQAFRQILPGTNFDSLVPTTIVVFRDDAAFRPFKPLRDNGDVRDNVRGYFQPGLDVNYIALSAEGDDKKVFGTIFHEYAHFIVNNNFGRANVPPWFNEGLACYFQTFQLETSSRAVVGDVLATHSQFLQRQELIPLETFLGIGYYHLRNQGAHNNSLFYSEAWALMHYLQHSNGGARRAQLEQFLNLLRAGKPQREAFQTAFQIDFAALEIELKKYVAQRSFAAIAIDLKDKIAFDNRTRAAAVSESDAAAFQGDLLLHNNRFAEAAVLLNQAVALDQNSAFAHASLGMTLVQQKDFVAARQHLEKAVQLNAKSYLTHFLLAYAVSREDLDADGYARFYLPENSAKMQTALAKAIELNPNYAESYRLLAFVNAVNNFDLNEAVELLGKALALAPGNQQYQLELAAIFLRQEKIQAAREVAQKVSDSAEDVDVRAQAQLLLANIARYEAALKSAKELAENPQPAPAPTPVLPEAELINQARNEALRRLRANEKRIVGFLTAIDCDDQSAIISLRADHNQEFKFSVANLHKLLLVSFTRESYGKQFGCDAGNLDQFVVATFRPNNDRAAKTTGEIVALEFMPKEFRLIQ